MAVIALAGVCIGLASPSVAVTDAGMTQDLLLRWTPPEEELGLVLDIAFALGLAFSAGFFARAWRCPDRRGVVVFGVFFAVLAAGWVFVPEFLKDWVRASPPPWWAR